MHIRSDWSVGGSWPGREEDLFQEIIRHLFKYLIISLSWESPKWCTNPIQILHKNKNIFQTEWLFPYKKPAIYKALTECRGMYIWVPVSAFVFGFFSGNPLSGLKGRNYYLHFPVEESKFRAVKWPAKVPTSCQHLRQDLNPGVPRAKAQVLSASEDCLMPAQSAPWITPPPCASILWHTDVIVVTRVEGGKMKPRDCFIDFPFMCLNGSSLY